MKKLLLFLSIITLSFTSCSKKDEFDPKKFEYDANLLYGTWYTDSYYDGGKNQNYKMDITLTFNSNGTFNSSGHAYFYHVEKYSLDGEYIHCNSCTIRVDRLSNDEMFIFWWLGDGIRDMQRAKFTKRIN